MQHNRYTKNKVYTMPQKSALRAARIKGHAQTRRIAPLASTSPRRRCPIRRRSNRRRRMAKTVNRIPGTLGAFYGRVRSLVHRAHIHTHASSSPSSSYSIKRNNSITLVVSTLLWPPPPPPFSHALTRALAPMCVRALWSAYKSYIIYSRETDPMPIVGRQPNHHTHTHHHPTFKYVQWRSDHFSFGYTVKCIININTSLCQIADEESRKARQENMRTRNDWFEEEEGLLYCAGIGE